MFLITLSLGCCYSVIPRTPDIAKVADGLERF